MLLSYTVYKCFIKKKKKKNVFRMYLIAALKIRAHKSLYVETYLFSFLSDSTCTVTQVKKLTHFPIQQTKH